ncbi:sulfite exporter TauE/SafE family protein [Conexibacter stalactiti]|uniref:Probable membrane transporter protein n=1 Tax=Conexibacter stalactiti TaxID=1940611 RepID=A0ABU4HSF1_9ACTN|nr:sulfite exporter TauE/SafE family protein [Conexibacter stalactiti]MDW5596253.1 sulfite exporter TauE/SafE family protein [Conexibacter stalactiti]MEC5036895.1 sulfite exporter TauE/SafE family protein [Conexibacter stalactiti]
MPDWLAAALIAFGVATITTPAGVSGAVFLLPVQVTLLHVPNPALSPTNLLFNVVATPGALLRFARRDGSLLRAPLTRLILAGSLPGVVLGAILRVELLSSRRTFLFVIAAVLAPLGLMLLRDQRSRRRVNAVRDATAPGRWIVPVAAGVGMIGGIYGIGGGSLLSPLLVSAGFTVAAVAPAALTSTFVTSVVGIAAFQLLALAHGGGEQIAPEWATGLALGAGGLAGSYLGATLQPRIPEAVLRRLLGVACILIAGRYLVEAIG